ncbi:MAG: type II toxin-antitoxin system RelB/DinJ family antitoxin [Oscillospiraceae bacterium]|jgi:DNA-damage-inducible protein J|nr:type II toxin-antitoxin system RelB/DinJ family antitoxin [Oscillospiraceae bacterium]
MAKTIQIRVDDNTKDAADALFSSLGLDTATAVRIFLAAAMEVGGIPFSVAHHAQPEADPDATIRASIAQRKAGIPGYSLEEFRASMQAAIARGAA